MSEPQLRATLLNPISPETAADAGGSRPTLVLGPSLGTGAKALWGPAVPLLAEHFTLIAWDLPGHGGSAASEADFTMAELAAAVVALLKTLEDEGTVDPDQSVFYAGVSIGGATGVQLGHDHPGLFAGLAIICSAAKIGTPEGWRERAELVAKAGTPTMVAGSAERWFAPGFIEANPVVSTDLLHTLQDADRFAYAHACEALAGYDLTGELGRITDPLLAIAGAHDAVCPPADARFLAAGVANGRAEVIDTVAHLAPAEDPAATAALLTGFFSAIPAQEATHG